MENTGVLKMAMIFLGVSLFMCVGGIIWLASSEPAKSIPDILVGTTTLIVGAMVGVLVPNKSNN